MKTLSSPRSGITSARSARRSSLPTLSQTDLSNRELVILHVERIMMYARHVDVTVRAAPPGPANPQQERADDRAPEGQGDTNQELAEPTMLRLPWMPTTATARKGVAWKPSTQANLDPAAIDALLTAIAKGRAWMNDLAEGRVGSFDEIARRENKVERHIRNLALLAFVSPRVIEAIANGSVSADLSVTTLARTLPRSWSEQERTLIVA